uniref:D-arabinono-1,4-lactone oxidase C-terminal domain-containing protein n=1 Tax=Tetradesmus obliquus TaxID=3088 RepID=A0A383WPT6_TETOB|eukprot:jgi/Sobl393_1/4656/SZX79283.1
MCQIAVPLSSLDIFWAVSKITKKGVTHGLAETSSILSSACHGGPDGSCSFTTVGHIGVGDIHFTIDQSDLRNWIADVKEVINKDLQNAGTSFFNALLGKDKRDCLPPGYFWLRFGNPTDDYVGLNAAPYKQPVHVQLSLFRNREHGAAPLKNGHVLAFLEQLTLCKYRGRPHFGKNYDRTFTYSKCPIADRHPQWSSWTAAAKQHDPLGLFASPLVATVLRNGSYENYPGCGIDGGCFCETDEHCRHPSQGTSYGWKCLPSKAFPDIKACRPV